MKITTIPAGITVSGVGRNRTVFTARHEPVIIPLWEPGDPPRTHLWQYNDLLNAWRVSPHPLNQLEIATGFGGSANAPFANISSAPL